MNAHTDDFANALRVCLDDLNMQAWRQEQAASYRTDAMAYRRRAHMALKRGFYSDFRHMMQLARRFWSLHKHYARKAMQ